MELDESIDLVDSEAVNAYGSVVAKEERDYMTICPGWLLRKAILEGFQ